MKKSYLWLALLACPTFGYAQNVGLNNDGTPAHPSAILDMKATDKGVLVPRITQAQRDAIVSPATGLLVYQTDNTPGFYYYNGTVWVPIGTGAAATPGWLLTGNAATAANFVGTTTDEPLRLRANNLEHARLTPRGALELGMNTSGNLFIGQGAGQNTDLANALVQANPNTFIGTEAGEANTTGFNNHFVGYRAGAANTTGNGNHFVGYRAGAANTTGFNNHFVGILAGFNNTTGDFNHFVGSGAGFNNTTGSLNHFVGHRAGQANTTGVANHFTGLQAGQANTTGNDNHFMGFSAGTVNTTGSNNHFVGNSAGFLNTTGNNNTFMGFQAGYTNDTGSRNLFLGYEAGRNLVNPSDQLVIANNQTTPLITGNFATGQVFNQLNSANWNVASDRRIKQNVRPLEGALATLLRVRPVRYGFTPAWVAAHPGVGGREFYGVIAQEYREVFPDDVKPTADLLPGDPDPVLGVDMGSAQIVAIRAIQELAAKVEALEKENAGLKTELGEAKAKQAQTETKLGENEKMRAEIDEVKAKLNELYKLLQAAAPGGGK